MDPREKKAYMEATPAQREVARRLLTNLLGLLRAQQMSYQTSHWQAAGVSSYGNHLLFARLYESVGVQIDQLAEKIAGYLGSDALGLLPQIMVVAHYCARWTTGLEIECPHRRGVQSEKDCQAAIKAAYDGIKAAQAMTLGLDDWLMATASVHEENTYLLQQALAAPPAAHRGASGAPSAEGNFRPNPRKEEVLEFAETGAVTNVPEIAADAAVADNLDISAPEAVAEAEAAPPTPTEIKEGPGGDAVSTLNRYVVESEDPEADKAAFDVHASRMAAWLLELEG